MKTNKTVATVGDRKPPQRRPGSKKDKWVRDAMIQAVNEWWEDPSMSKEERLSAPRIKKLRKMVDVMVEEAIDGNVQAFNAIADRIDGRPVPKADDGGLASPAFGGVNILVQLVEPDETHPARVTINAGTESRDRDEG